MKKTAGILCDNYKTTKFKEELKKANLEIKSVTPLQGKGNLTSIIVETEEENIPKVKTICEQVELHFQGLKN